MLKNIAVISRNRETGFRNQTNLIQLILIFHLSLSLLQRYYLSGAKVRPNKNIGLHNCNN